MLSVRVKRFVSAPKAVLLAAMIVSALSAFAETAPKRILLIDSQNGEPYASVRNGLLDRLSAFGYDEKSGTLETKLHSMGNSPDLAARLNARVTKPIMGLTREHVAAADSAAIVIYPDPVSMGAKGAELIGRYFAGEAFKALYPCSPEVKPVYSAKEMARFGLTVPE